MTAAKRKLGRPPLTAGRRERINITLPPEVARWLRTYGGGNLSGAICELVRQARREP